MAEREVQVGRPGWPKRKYILANEVSLGENRWQWYVVGPFPGGTPYRSTIVGEVEPDGVWRGRRETLAVVECQSDGTVRTFPTMSQTIVSGWAKKRAGR